jgi:hypothetical protein
MDEAPPPPGPINTLTEREKKWRLRLTQAEFLQKVVISLIGTLAVAIFYTWQANQAESHYYADLQSEREKSDIALRGEMFRTLVDTYFTRKSEDARKAAGGNSADRTEGQRLLNSIEQDIMLSDLLSRNFETIDVRPLFEDLDRRLASLQGGGDLAAVTADQKRAFLLRERLRRVAAGATARQRLLLEWAGGSVFGADVESCPSQDASATEGYAITTKIFSVNTRSQKEPYTDSLPVSVTNKYSDYVKVTSLKDASVSILGPFSAKASQAVPPSFTVTYFDMPLLETVRLSSGERVAFTVAKHVSARTCSRRLDDDSLTPGERAELGERCGHLKERCEWASLAITILPADFIGSRDRPYLDQLAKRQRGLELGQIWDWLTGRKDQ